MSMSYVYTEQRPELFTESGVETLAQIRRNVNKALDIAGAVRAQEAWTGVTVSPEWLMLAALDYMVEKGELREVTDPDTDPDTVWAQHRVFVAPQ